MNRPARAALAFAAAALALGVAAPAAAADPPRPTDDRSTLERIQPPAPGISLEVAGGDAFLALEVEPGVEVTVPGYGGEPYVRVLADGTVERNRRSRATYINEDRLGDAPAPADLATDDEPEWEQVGSDGTYAWHDHRIHWMSPDRPPGLEPGDVIDPSWEVPLVVDGTEVVATGRLVWEEDVSPVPWLALAAVVAAGTWWLATRVRPTAVAAVAGAVGAAVATVVGAAEWSSFPAGSGGSPLVVVVPAVGLVAAVAGLLLHRRPAGVACTLGAASATIGWAALRAGVFLHPVLPTELPPALDRAGTAVALGAAVAAAVVAVRSGAPARPGPAGRTAGAPSPT